MLSIHNLPVNEFNSSLVSTSYKLAVLSHDAVIIWSPPSNQSLAITGPLCPKNVHEGVRNIGTTRSSSVSVSSDSRSLYKIKIGILKIIVWLNEIL